MGRNELINRLAAQVGSKEKALLILKRRGDVDKDGNLTTKGKTRDRMTAAERAIDRAAKRSGKPRAAYVYDPRTNLATLRTNTKKTRKKKRK
jgi:fatty acid-binding protein DegV